MQHDQEGNEWNANHPFFDYSELEFYGTNPDADFDCWGKVAPSWTIEEGIALSFGKNPRVVNWAILSSCPEHPFAIEYRRRLELAVRAEAIGDLQPSNRPADFIKWAKANGFEFPAELEEAVNKRAPTESQPREPKAMLKMIAVLVKTFHFDPYKNNKAAASIASKIHLHGMDIDEKTVREYLKKAFELIPNK
jgi:hypothetical protein